LEKHQNIYQSAMELFLQFGLQKVNVQEIADAAGVSKKTLYNHFDGKEDIFFRTIEWHIKEMLKFYNDLLADQDITLTEKLVRAIQYGANEFSFKQSQLSSDMSRFNPYLKEKPLNYIRRNIRKAIAGLIDIAKEEGLCRTDYSTDKLVYVILTMINGLLSWEDLDEPGIRIPELFQASITLILDSLLTDQGRAMLPMEELTQHGLGQ
jgi:AcrR family transcriptional regulator